jgi:hypothetical protein
MFYIVLRCSFFNSAQTKTKSKNTDYNKWSIELAGVVQTTRPLGSGYFTSTQTYVADRCTLHV